MADVHRRQHLGSYHVPLADACVTEWRGYEIAQADGLTEVPLADACVTEWRAL